MKTLFDQTRIGNIRLKNRLIRSATGETLAKEGHLSAELLEVYEELARGGVGTIITSFAYVVESEQPFPGMLGIYNDSFIEEYKRLTDMVHRYETNIILQMVHCGSYRMKEAGGQEVWGPSAVENLQTHIQPGEMTVENILALQKAFATAAARAKQAGFDGVQIHAAHGFLLNQFLSPYYNRRTDEYGGTIENRSRMILETYSAVREAVGDRYPVLIKLNNSDGMEQGMTIEDSKYVCRRLAEAQIDAIEISGAWHQFTARQDSYFKETAAEIAVENNIPVIVVGGNRDYQAMTEILNQTAIKYFSFSRPFIAEPGLVNRWQRGDVSRSKCISCNSCANLNGGLTCILNR